MNKKRYEIVGNYLEKKTGFRKSLEFGSHRTMDEAITAMKALRIKYPTYDFHVNEIEGWD